MSDYYRKIETKDSKGRALYVEYEPVEVNEIPEVRKRFQVLWMVIVVLGAIASFLMIMVCVL